MDRIEEAWYLMKEAELQATYMQGISDGMDMQKEKLRRVLLSDPYCLGQLS